MKRFIPLLALGAAGIATSFALASPAAHGNKCHPVNFKGMVTGGTLMVTNISHISGPSKNLTLGSSASLTVSGKVSVQAWSCTSTGTTTTTLFLRQLHVGGKPGGTTTTG